MNATTSMRVLVSLGVLATLLLSADHSRAGDPPSFSDLPVGRFTVPPKKKIDGIPARESVPGIFVVAPKHIGNLPAQHRYSRSRPTLRLPQPREPGRSRMLLRPRA